MFNKLISPFIEMLKKRGWQLFSEHKASSFAALVKEFYGYMVGVKGKKVCVRGKLIYFCRELINEMFNLKCKKIGQNSRSF